jgi:hypothetical protein
VAVPAFADETEIELAEAVEPAHEDAADPAAADPLTTGDVRSVTTG